ncbi:DUF6985 domain-containing protein [Aquisphaera insulae]|uniref:DUF6985 domain-containing protein n=1 Tax=Aquisphaera insulae TaxID=2712864 RepID=UPI0013EA8BD5|nr:hypothetical protein [Aquisphaera insulae]
MRHELFGDLTHDRDEGAWSGTLPLPRLVAFGRRTEAADRPSVEEMISGIREGLDRAMERMRERPEPDVVARLRRAAEAPAEPGGRKGGIPGLSADQEAALDRAGERSRADDRRRKAGDFPIWIEAPRDAGPAPAQEAAGRLLIDREDEICRAVVGVLFASYLRYYRDEQGRFANERLRALYGLPAIATPEGLTAIAHLLHVWIPRLQIEGVAPLFFPVDCDWEAEHGLFAVYHPTLGADWTTFDGLHDYTLLDDGPADGG